MKLVALYVCAAALFVAVMMSVMYGVRWFSAVVTPSPTVTRPADGMVCAHIITADGAAISCINDQMERSE